MTSRDTAPIGSPCWVDLWTSDVEGSRRFYSELFGWQAEEPSPEFGGYFMFTRNGAPVAGGMGDMGDMHADNKWKIYLTTDDINKTLEAAESGGAQIAGGAMPVADLGVQAVMVDPAGAPVGAWQPGTFQGFSTLGEHGSPSWFELHTASFATAVNFYTEVFRLQAASASDTDEFRYTMLRQGDEEVAGVMDASAFLPEGAGASWSVYWEVDDVDATLAKVRELGGTVVHEAEDTPYGRLATAADPSGAQFKLRSAAASA